jgi:UDP-2-acetamido-2-deoxy-ribo-hexuluronate aminotransferase
MMQFIDLKAQQDRIRKQIDANILKVLDHGKYIMGPEVYELEEKLADYVGVKHCIGVSSGTDALLIALMSLGIERGDEVITTPFTFIATGEVIALLQAKPVFVDIDPKTYNIDASQIESAITPNTRAIMPVSLYGQCSDMDAINVIANRHGLPVIEDAAQSFGAIQKGKKSCALSTIGCTSFFPSKPLGGYGDSGACFTDDDELAKTMREVRVHGQDRRYHHSRIGINGRMDTIQAAILLAKLDIFPEEVILRGEVSRLYTTMLNKEGITATPYIESYNESVFAQYTIQVSERERVVDQLRDAEIPTAVHYPIDLNRQPVFISEKQFPVSERTSTSVLSLPMHPYLKKEEQEKVVNTLCAI